MFSKLPSSLELIFFKRTKFKKVEGVKAEIVLILIQPDGASIVIFLLVLVDILGVVLHCLDRLRHQLSRLLNFLELSLAVEYGGELTHAELLCEGGLALLFGDLDLEGALADLLRMFLQFPDAFVHQLVACLLAPAHACLHSHLALHSLSVALALECHTLSLQASVALLQSSLHASQICVLSFLR